MLNAKLAEHDKQMGLNLVESNNQTFLETMRGAAKLIARRNGEVNADDLREYFNDNKTMLQIPSPTNANTWGAIFKGNEWVLVGYMKSTQVSRRGGVIRRWTLKI